MNHYLSYLNSLQRFWSSHILLCHATYSTAPRHLAQRLHNVSPITIYQQLSWLGKYFDFVKVDDLFAAGPNARGKIAVTFDDAYRSVFTEALPIIETLGIPCTVFVNGVTLETRHLWRDKIRVLINGSLVVDFVQRYGDFCAANGIGVDNFYRSTKHPSVNSAELDVRLDEFLEDGGPSMTPESHCISDARQLRRHPQVSYGNHSYNHYVLSSLTDEQQHAEVSRNHDVLAALDINRSRVFSIPFGGAKHVGDGMWSAVKKHGYVGVVYSRNSINLAKRRDFNETERVASRERYRVPSEFGAFQKRMARVFMSAVKQRLKARLWGQSSP